MNEIDSIRASIDSIDAELVALFERRMSLCAEVAEYKKHNGLAILNSTREAEVLSKNSALLSEPSLKPFYCRFQSYLMSLSREYQEDLCGVIVENNVNL